MTANVALYAPSAEVIPLGRLRQLTAGARVSACYSPDGDVSAYRVVWDDVAVTLNVMPEDRLAEHLLAFQAYVVRLSRGQRQRVRGVVDRLRGVRLIHGVVIEPDFDAEGKVNRLVLDLMQHYGALLFANDSVYDERVNLLIGPADAEPEGEGGPGDDWQPTPNQLERAERSRALLRRKKVPLYEGPLFVDDDRAVKVRPAAEVARRALALWAVALRGEGAPRQEARGLIDQAGAWEAVSPQERAFLDDPDPDPQLCSRFAWRREAVWVLLWALGHLEELGWPDGVGDVPRLTAFMHVFENDPDFIAQARLRTAADVLDAQDLTRRLHWAVRDAWLNQRPVPADLDWSGPAPRLPAERCAAVGVVEQRHLALNWLAALGGADWDDVDTPT